MHPIDQLFAALPSVAPYPTGVLAVPDRIPGVAFFPGGAGLWDVKPRSPLPEMPVGGVMVLGHDFHSEAGFAMSLRQGSEVHDGRTANYRMAPTWTNLLALLRQAGIPERRCFFTNAYMGLRSGTGTMGRFPGSLDAGFVQRCRTFLVRQLATQRPSVILTIGTWVPRFIAPLSANLSSWTKAASMKTIDEAGAAHHDVEFPAVPGLSRSVAALTHPSLRPSNVRHRQFGSLSGHTAELAIIAEIIARSRLRR